MDGTASTCLSFEQLPPPLQERLAARVQRLGYLGEFFQRAAHQPAALAHFHDWTEALKAAIPPRMLEAIALTIATYTANDYERVQHERLALSIGMTPDEILAIQRARCGEVSTITPEEAAAAMLSRSLLDDTGIGCGPAVLRLSRLVGEPLAVACLMAGARYIAHAAMANAWGLAPPVNSPFDDTHANDA